MNELGIPTCSARISFASSLCISASFNGAEMQFYLTPLSLWAFVMTKVHFTQLREGGREERCNVGPIRDALYFRSQRVASHDCAS
jgi:hypothetical protein